MAVCLLSSRIQAFKEALKRKEIKMEDLLNLETPDLIKKLEPYAGLNAKDVATLFEQKRILKNQTLGIKNAVSKLGEIGRYDPAKKAMAEAQLKEFRNQQIERIFNPNDKQAFYSSLAEKLLGTEVTREQSKALFEIAKKANDLRTKNFNETTEIWSDSKAEFDFGATQKMAELMLESFKGNDIPLKALLKGKFSEYKQLLKENKRQLAKSLALDTLKLIRDTAIESVSTLDNTFQARQGWNVLNNKPLVWAKGFNNSWLDMFNTLKGDSAKVDIALWAKIYSDPNYMKGRYRELLPKFEEEVPTKLLERIPILGRFFKASNNAFVGSALRMRVGVAKSFFDTWKLAGEDINNPAIIKDVNRLALQMTARSKLGKVGAGLLSHYVFWAPRMLKSSWDTLFLPLSPTLTPIARRAAAMNLLRFVVVAAIIKGTANALSPGSSPIDPRSTGFKSIKIGDTRFSWGIGELSLLTLASKLAGSWHNGVWGFWYVDSKGKYRKYSFKYGEKTPFDIGLEFLTNKASPFPTRLLIDFFKQSMFGGEKISVKGEAKNLLPISVQNVINLPDEKSADAVLGVIADTLGFGATTYSK